MAKLEHATDFQMLYDSYAPSKRYDDKLMRRLIERIDRLMGKNAALIADSVDAMGGFTDDPLTAEEFLAVLKRKWQERDMWEEQADKRLAALTAQVERLTEPVNTCPHCGSNDKHWKRVVGDKEPPHTLRICCDPWHIAARAAAPATGAEQVHAPKTIVPEPDQRRIETERFPPAQEPKP